MRLFARFFIIFALMSGVSIVFAGNCGQCKKEEKHCKQKCDQCCEKMGGVQYCDSSAGRLVCKNGFYSSCYCTRHAQMGLDHIQGCCLWQGGVMTIDDATGAVVCNDGSVSAICSFQEGTPGVATW